MIKRRSYSQGQKIAFIEEWLASELTQRNFCRSKNLAFNSFGNWLKLYRLDHDIPAKVRLREPSPHFVSLELSNTKDQAFTQPSAQGASGISILQSASFSEVEITYSTGTSLKIGSAVELDQLRTLLTLL